MKTGRFLSLTYFAEDAYKENHNKIADLVAAYPDVDIICYDNSGNKGSERPNGGRVSVDEAIKWDYTINEDLYNQLIDIIEDGINERRFTKDQVASIGQDLRGLTRDGVEPWAVSVRHRAEGVERRIREYGDSLLQQEVRGGSSGSPD